MYELILALTMLTATVAVAEAAGNYDCGASTCIGTDSAGFFGYEFAAAFTASD